MGSRSSSVRHLFKAQNVLVLRDIGTNDGWEPCSPTKAYLLHNVLNTHRHSLYILEGGGLIQWKEEGVGKMVAFLLSRVSFPSFPNLSYPHLFGRGWRDPCLSGPHPIYTASAYPEKLSVQLISEKKDLIYWPHAFVQLSAVLNLLIFKYGTS